MKYTFILVVMLLALALAKPDKCRILSFSSGTEKVAYQVGALKALIENLDPKDVEYNVISGVSFGAFNAAIASVHKVGEEKAMIEELYSIWKDSEQITAYQNWWFGPFQGAFFKGGLYDNSPWEDYLKRTLDGRDTTKMITLGAVDVISGEYKDLSDIRGDVLLQDAVFAATAVNVFFPPVHKFETDWFDGSGVWPIEVIGPIKRCEQMGYKEKDIVVDILMTNSYELPARDAENDKTIPSVLRYLEISDFYSSVNGLARAIAGFKDINFRYCINPGKKHLATNWFPFDFNQKKVDKLLDRGYSDAMDAIQRGEKDTCTNMVIEHKNMRAPKPPKELEKLMKGEIE
jgi:predicted acylesterase/phospholipase RssA